MPIRSPPTSAPWAECNKAGAGDCVVKVSLKDNCAALAISVDKTPPSWCQGRDQVATTATAMQQCQIGGAGDCQIRENICSSAQ